MIGDVIVLAVLASYWQFAPSASPAKRAAGAQATVQAVAVATVNKFVSRSSSPTADA